ncbi:lysophospholipid acyltransferase family protein [Ihubacter sp. rT4E-8]|uniref:lysophospholipid acyltransferase family protein n=1 Tax=unclassified Ihubacter TaxID=2633299 RepID=UPI00137B193F
MKLLRNIPNGIKLFRSVSIFNYYLKDLEALRASGQGEKERELIAYATGLWVDKVIDIFDLTVNVSGKENIPADGPCVFIANHQGYADIVVLFKAAEGRQIGFIAKDSLQKVPYFGKWIQAIRGVFIKRGDAREALKSIQDGVQTLKEGYSLVIFPEGTRSRSTAMGHFKAGSFKLATKAKVPIVPITINGTRHMFEDRGVITGGATVDILIHPSIDTASLDRHETANIVHQVEDTIRKGLDKLIEVENARVQKEE